MSADPFSFCGLHPFDGGSLHEVPSGQKKTGMKNVVIILASFVLVNALYYDSRVAWFNRYKPLSTNAGNCMFGQDASVMIDMATTPSVTIDFWVSVDTYNLGCSTRGAPFFGF